MEAKLNLDDPSKLSADVYDNNPIDKLSNELLLEILIRLPSCKFAIRSKLVAKRWLNLLSSNFFVSQSLSRIHDNINNKPPLPFALIDQYTDVDFAQRILVHSKDNHLDFANSGFTFDFAPQFRNQQGELVPKVVSIWGVHQDLILLSVVKMCKLEYYLDEFVYSPAKKLIDEPHRKFLICNPITRKWVSLPPIPYHPVHPNYVAFVCEPFYAFDNVHHSSKSCCLRDSYRYRVLSVASVRYYVDVFISETRRWGQLFLLYPNEKRILKLRPVVPPVVNNGMVYWVSESNMVAFDPFGVEKNGIIAVSCRVIDFPVAVLTNATWKVGTCSGTLRLCRTEWQPGNCHLIRVWDLIEDYDECHDKGTQWCIKHQFTSNDFKVSHNSSLKIDLEDPKAMYNLHVLGVHPYDMDILHILFGHNIVECNMQTQTLEATAEYHPHISPSFSHGNLNESIGYDMKNMYQVFLPWWPTPLPALS